MPKTQMWVRNLKPEHLECRKYGHCWIEGVDAKFKIASGNWCQDMICERCDTMKLIVYEKDGTVGWNHYWYADDYLKPEGEETVVRSEYTNLLLHRAKTKPAPAEAVWRAQRRRV